MNLYLGRVVRAREPNPVGKSSWTVRNPNKGAGLMMFGLLNRKWILCCSPSPSNPNSAKEPESSNRQHGFATNKYEIEALITDICETDSVAEFELKMDDFQMYLKRDFVRESVLPPPSLPSAPLELATTPKETAKGCIIRKLSLTITKPVLCLERKPSLLERAADEGLAILQSPKVGFFRRSRTIKGKRAPPACEESKMVKEGQVLCYIDQLGGEIPIESLGTNNDTYSIITNQFQSDVTGEIIQILLEDGDPVGYDDALIMLLPSFPGIKKLQ